MHRHLVSESLRKQGPRVRFDLRLVVFLVFGAVFSGCLAQNDQISQAELVVHVLESDVEIVVGDQSARVTGEPLQVVVFDLTAGAYDLSTFRNGDLLLSERLTISSGDSIVRVVWDPVRSGELTSDPNVPRPDYEEPESSEPDATWQAESSSTR